MTPILMPLKAKYRQPGRKRPMLKGCPEPDGGTFVYSYGLQIGARSRTGNSHGPTPKDAKKGSLKARKRQYGPF